MNFLWVNVLEIYFGLQGVIAAYSDGYIGCYKLNLTMVGTELNYNSGHVCKNHCFPHERYAGTSFRYCYCMKKLDSQPTRDWDCSFDCPDQTNAGEICGGIGSLTVYDALATTSSTLGTSTLNTPTTPTVTSTVKTTSKMMKTITGIDNKGMQTTDNSTFDTDPVNSTSLENTSITAVRPVVTTDEVSVHSRINTDPVSSISLEYIAGCVIMCVVIGVCLVVTNNVILCVCKKIRRSKQGNKAQVHGYGYISPVNVTELDDSTLHHYTLPVRNEVATSNPGNKIQVDGYGYISPINVIELDDTTPHDYTVPVRNEVTKNIAGTSSDMYEDWNTNAAECQYTGLV